MSNNKKYHCRGENYYPTNNEPNAYEDEHALGVGSMM